MVMRNYQNNFSDKISSVLDSGIRIRKAKKIVAVIKNFLEKENKILENAICLDIGGSAGFAAKELISENIKKIYIVDIDKKALEFGKKNNFHSKIIYQVGDAMALNFPDDTFDIIICNQVYEHVSDHYILVKEIYRVLKKGGVCYFGAGNRVVLIEPHYNLPFLSWLPKKLANLYLKFTRGENYYYENLLSYFGLIKLLKSFKIYDYTIEVIKNPVKYYNDDLIKPNSFLTKVPIIFLKIIISIIPSYIFILIKRANEVLDNEGSHREIKKIR